MRKPFLVYFLSDITERPKNVFVVFDVFTFDVPMENLT